MCAKKGVKALVSLELPTIAYGGKKSFFREPNKWAGTMTSTLRNAHFFGYFAVQQLYPVVGRSLAKQNKKQSRWVCGRACLAACTCWLALQRRVKGCVCVHVTLACEMGGAAHAHKGETLSFLSLCIPIRVVATFLRLANAMWCVPAYYVGCACNVSWLCVGACCASVRGLGSS